MRLDKNKIFTFLKAKIIIEEHNVSQSIIVNEKNNEGKSLSKCIIKNLDNQSKYWTLNPENVHIAPTGKKTEVIILEYTNDKILNIVLFEMKSKSFENSDIRKKFESSLSWVLLLLNLLENKQGQKIKVFGILVAQKDKKWNKYESLKIFESLSVDYIKRSFHTLDSIFTVDYQELIRDIS